MGDIIPTRSPTIDRGAVYSVTGDRFFDLTPATDCTQTYINTVTADVDGDVLDDFLKNHDECQNEKVLFPLETPVATRITNIVGPL